MTHEGAPAVFVIHEVPAVYPGGARRRDGLTYPTDFEIARRSKVSA
jgi:hypothetical protein